MAYQYQASETPFAHRHQCWFCGEPANQSFYFPQEKHIVLNCVHPALSLPCCAECLQAANKSKASNIWAVQTEVKRVLLKSYRKDLAIGVNWTKEELEKSGFESGNFAGFQRSAWMMYEIAKARVNFAGWPLTVAGLNIEEFRWQTPDVFIFDGVSYPSIEDAIAHYAQIFDLHLDYFKQVLFTLGQDKFSQAVRFCRLQVGATLNERKRALKALSKPN